MEALHPVNPNNKPEGSSSLDPKPYDSSARHKRRLAGMQEEEEEEEERANAKDVPPYGTQELLRAMSGRRDARAGEGRDGRGSPTSAAETVT